MIFSVYSVKMVLPFCQKSRFDILPKKIHLKMTLPESLKKMIFILENMVFLLIEKLKMIKKFTFRK